MTVAVSLDVRAKRIYHRFDPADGHRVLIDYFWLPGVTRERALLDAWARDLAPASHCADDLITVPNALSEFRRGYRDELAGHPEALDDLRRCDVRREPHGELHSDYSHTRGSSWGAAHERAATGRSALPQVTRMHHGQTSNWIRERLRVGDEVNVSGPCHVVQAQPDSRRLDR